MPAGLRAVQRRHRRGGVEWTPIQLPNLVVWASAAAVVGLNNNDSIGTSLLDLSGNGNDPAILAGTPLYVTNQQNGLPGVSFPDGVANMGCTFTTLSQPFSVYWVGKTDGTSGYLFDSRNIASETSIRRFDVNDYAIIPPNNIFTTGSTADNNWHIVAGIFNGASGSARFDGTSTAENTSTNTMHSGIRLGANRVGGAVMTGVMGEFLVTSDAISVGNIALLEHYFSAQWAIGAL